MPVITEITSQKKDPTRRNIFIDHKFFFGISQELVSQKALKIGQELSDLELEELRQAVQSEKVFAKVLNYLSYRPRSEFEIRIYLSRLKPLVNEDEQDSIVEELKRLRYVDDQAFAEWYVRQRREIARKYGQFRIRNELRRLGITEEHMTNAFTLSDQELNEYEIALYQGKKILRRLGTIGDIKNRKKFYDGLGRRGFSGEIINRVIKDLQRGEREKKENGV